MSNTTTYKIVMIALIAGSTVACHYQAGTQYVDDKDVPGADSGTRRVSTTTMRSDSTNMPLDSTVAKPADTTSPKPGSASKTHPTSMAIPPASERSATTSTRSASASTRPRAKFTHGRASVTATKIYTTAEIAPVFPGGQKGLDNYINHTVKYPQQAIDDDVSGTIHVSFVVDEQGHVTKAKVVDAANVGDGLDQEALRVVKNMPVWTPGMVKGKKVKTRVELPINFQVES